MAFQENFTYVRFSVFTNTSKLHCKTASVFVSNLLLPRHSKLECDLAARGFFSTRSKASRRLQRSFDRPSRRSQRSFDRSFDRPQSYDCIPKFECGRSFEHSKLRLHLSLPETILGALLQLYLLLRCGFTSFFAAAILAALLRPY